VPGLEIGQGDRADGGELGLARVGAVDAVDQLVRFTPGDLVLVVVAAHDGSGLLLLGQLQFIRAELGMKQQIHGQRKDLVGVAFERVPGEGGGVIVASSLDVRGLGFEQVVHGVAVHFGRAAGAPCLPVKADQAGFRWSLIARAARDEHRAVDEGKLVVFLQKDHDAVVELNAPGLLRVKLVQLGGRDSLPGLGLLGVHNERAQERDEECGDAEALTNAHRRTSLRG